MVYVRTFHSGTIFYLTIAGNLKNVKESTNNKTFSNEGILIYYKNNDCILYRLNTACL